MLSYEKLFLGKMIISLSLRCLKNITRIKHVEYFVETIFAKHYDLCIILGGIFVLGF